MNKNNGFTLIELVVVIVILGILAATAAPKFIDVSDDAMHAKVKANAAALKSSVKLANMKWRAIGSPSALADRDNIQLYGNDASGQIDINIQGFPAQSYSGSDVVLSADNDDDCLSLWQVLIQNGNNKAAVDDSSEFITNYEGAETCSYKLNDNLAFGFVYDSKTGAVDLL